MNLKLLKTEIQDLNVRENFNRIENSLRDESILKAGFSFYEFDVSAPAPGPTEVKLYVKMDYLPKDVILTRHTGSTFTFLYDKFTKDYLVISATGPCKIRAFVGTYSEGRTV